MKWNLIVDVANCSNCGNCVLAVKDEYTGNEFPGYASAQPSKGHKWFWVDRIVRGSGSAVDVVNIPKTCNHCDDAPCQRAAPDVVEKRSDGIVIIHPTKSIGRRDLVTACPYGAISWNEETQSPQSWPFDAHLLDNEWAIPRCVQVCPTGCLSAVKVTDQAMASLVAQEDLVVLKPELKTKPRVYYKNYAKAEHCFIAGTVIGTDGGGRKENLVGVEVRIRLDGGEARLAHTDSFGDFKVDGIKPGQEFVLEVVLPENRVVKRTGSVSESLNLGEISTS